MLRNNSRNGITRNGNRPQRIGDQLLFFYFGKTKKKRTASLYYMHNTSKIYQKIKIKNSGSGGMSGAVWSKWERNDNENHRRSDWETILCINTHLLHFLRPL